MSRQCRKCSKRKRCRNRQGLKKEQLDILDEYVKSKVDNGACVGNWVFTEAGKDCHESYFGVINVENEKPMASDTIVRCASVSKIYGAAAILKLYEQGKLNLYGQLSNYIPEFADTKVIDPFITLPPLVLGLDPLETTNTSNVITVTQVAHGFADGQVIGLQGSTGPGDLVNGIPVSEINNVHSISNVTPNTYDITVSTSSNADGNGGGNNVNVYILESGVKQTIFNGTIYYYKELDLVRPIMPYDILTHRLGYCYYLSAGVVPSGYVGENDQLLMNIQAGIYIERELTMGIPEPNLSTSSLNIKEWSKILASVPLLFQPGGDWAYGPVTSTEGALIEILDGRTVENYMKEEIFDHLGMKDTGFFIQNNDPDRQDKLDRIMTLYLAGTTTPVLNIPPIAYFDDFFYGLNQPKALSLIDGGMYTTPKDLSLFLRMMKNMGSNKFGKCIISKAAICAMSNNNNMGDDTRANWAPFPSGPGKWPKWGLNMAAFQGSNMIMLYPGCSERSFGWSGALRIRVTVDTANDSIVVAGTNVVGSGPLDGFRDIATDLSYAAFKRINPNNSDVSVNNSEPSSY